MAKLRNLWVLFASFMVLIVMAAPSSVTAALANVSHAYLSDTSISNGNLVSLDSGKSGYVVPANINNGARLAGVAVAAKDSLLAVNPSSNAVQVATTGNVNVLVSTVNGNISVGNQISVSPFNGLGMKAEPGLNIIGLAQTNLNNKTTGVSREEVTNKSGQKSTIWVGLVSLSINITTDDSSASGNNLNGLQNFVKGLTGHVISTFRIIISLIIIAVTCLALIVVVYSAIYGSIISVGRNPLARHAILGTLRSVLFMTLLVAAVACVMIYLLLS